MRRADEAPVSISGVDWGEARPGRRRVLDVLAALGVAFVLYQLWGYVAWLVSDDFRAGPTPPVPDDVRGTVVFAQWLMVTAAAVWAAWLVVDVRRRRTLTWSVLLTLVWLLTSWQESLANVTGPRFAWNTQFVDRGDWTPFLPFVPGGGPGLAQPLVMEPAFFFSLLPALALGIAALMRGVRRLTRIRSRWALAVIAYAAGMVLEFAVETRSIRTGANAYPSLYGALSIHDGRPDQFPLYETALLGLAWALPGIALYLIRDAQPAGAALLTPPRWRPGRWGTGATVLAAVGALNVAFLLYNLVAFVWLPADTVAPMPPWLTP